MGRLSCLSYVVFHTDFFQVVYESYVTFSYVYVTPPSYVYVTPSVMYT